MSRERDLEHSGQALRQVMAEALPGADDETIEIVGAVTGLLAALAYADRTISEEEASHLEEELGRIHGLTPDRVHAVAEVLQKHALRFSTAYVQRFTRVLRDHLPEEMRAEVLDALLGMAAADGVITFEEVTQLRNITQAMGLSQTHYNALQEKYRDKLA